MYHFSMILVIIASVFYHICQKSINENANPIVSMIATYGVALILSLFSIFFFPSKNIINSFKELNWASYILGISIFALEIGYLLVYRSGWNINVAAFFTNVITTIVLIFIGILFFKEKLTVTNVIGIVLSILGFILMKK
ncbi:EamA-like transporter family protein [Caminicella sporogenes DSM 14501]|uniref:EamA-like transporter family protein n=2 Tax=Caminicella TaxID=166484 RepID=A0A1M6P149_9FIRM|nr:EamA family transporter [Caminicella sporogenes]RKD21642.1 hypothetical protein BET04_07545 [Caminicella sporogenes]SHK01634.1 EamA-like transporter family protein [Caminicella sporogenes DSM 14501]